jgi:hypothetical protein
MKKDSRTPEQNCHRGMMQRCYNPNAGHYHRYGGTGITVCDRWRFGEKGKTAFQCFLEDMGNKPSSIHSIDRINRHGNYEPSNCKWSTPLEQQLNLRRLVSKLEYACVYAEPSRGKFRAQISIANKTAFIGRFDTPEQAALAYNDAAIKRGKTTGLNWVTPQVVEIAS